MITFVLSILPGVKPPSLFLPPNSYLRRSRELCGENPLSLRSGLRMSLRC
jgi:hypothetical protein